MVQGYEHHHDGLNESGPIKDSHSIKESGDLRTEQMTDPVLEQLDCLSLQRNGKSAYRNVSRLAIGQVTEKVICCLDPRTVRPYDDLLMNTRS